MMEHLKEWWLLYIFGTFVVSVGSGTVKRLAGRIKARDAEIRRMDAEIRQTDAEILQMREGLKDLYYQCIVDCFCAVTELGYCPLGRLQNVEEVYGKYHAWGGNGAADQMMTEIRALPKTRKARAKKE
jgi:hypothetical protein